MKKFFIIILTLVSFSASAQQNETVETKFNKFMAQSGVIKSFEDYQTVTLKNYYGSLTMHKRMVTAGDETKTFIILKKPGKYDTYTAAIAQEDYQDLLRALEVLKTDGSTDVNTAADYMEKFFATEDHLKFGYYVSKGKINWYINLDSRLSDRTFFIKDIEEFTEKLMTFVPDKKELSRQ